MDRRHLEYFVAVADHGAFTSAAHALHVAQPSLSQAIKFLEAEVGSVLFHRTTRGVLLTPAGEALLGPARQVLRDFDAASAAVVNVHDLTTGRLDIVALPMLAADPLADILGDFHAAHPGVVVRVAEPGSADIVDLVKTGVHEIAVTLRPKAATGLKSWESDSEPIHLVVSRAIGPTADELISADQLAQLGLVVNTGTKQLLTDMLHEVGIAPRIVAESAHRDAIVPLVLRGIGAALLPPRAAADAARQGAVVCRLGVPLHRQVAVLWRPRQLTPAATAFLELLQSPRQAGRPSGPQTSPCTSPLPATRRSGPDRRMRPGSSHTARGTSPISTPRSPSSARPSEPGSGPRSGG